LTDFGAFVEVEDGIDGLVHVSDLAWDKKIKHPSETLKKGDEVEAVILRIDTENQRLSLGIKQLTPSAYDAFFAVHDPGEVLEGTIVRFAEFGAFVELSEGVEGLVHISELAPTRVEKPEELFQVGQKVQVKVLRLDPTERKIGLSIRAVTEGGDISPERYSSGMQPGSGSISLGDFADLRADGKRRTRKGRHPKENLEGDEEDYDED